MWCKFTRDNIKHFFNYNINNNNILLKLIKNEREKIKNFIINNNKNILIKILDSNNINIDPFINHWVDKNITYELPKLVHNYSISWDDNIIIIKSYNNINDICKKFTLIIHIYEYLKYNNNIHKNVSIYLILSNLIKKLPDNNNIINIQHVNTGYTDFSNNTIFIWRLEEFEKVLFHEFIHFLNLDIKNNTHFTNNIVNYNEAVTDFWGIIYYIIFLSLMTNIKIKKLLEIELNFIKNQANLLSNYLNINSISNISHIKQKTHAFSYYIFKYLIFDYFICLDINYDINNVKNEFNDFHILYNNIINKNFKPSKFIYLNSTRMTLLQLN